MIRNISQVPFLFNKLVYQKNTNLLIKSETSLLLRIQTFCNISSNFPKQQQLLTLNSHSILLIKRFHFQNQLKSNQIILNINNNLRNRQQFLNQQKRFNSTESETVKPKEGIFKRFKSAYKQHGKVLIYTHIVTCCGWITGFYLLSQR
jgi:hypothetical protein